MVHIAKFTLLHLGSIQATLAKLFKFKLMLVQGGCELAETWLHILAIQQRANLLKDKLLTLGRRVIRAHLTLVLLVQR